MIDNFKDSFLNLFIRYSWLVLGLVSVLQCAFWPSWENLFAIAVIVISWKLFEFLVLRYYVIVNFPLSFFLIFGFALTQYYLPPLFTLVEGKPVTFNLDVPYLVFVHSFLNLMVIVSAHLIYRFNLKGGLPKLRSILAHAKLFTPPRDLQVWLMGFIGLGSMFYVYFYAPSANIVIAGPLDKIIQGLVPFSYAPFFILLGQLYGRKKRVSKKAIIQLLFYFFLLLAISLGRNSRSSFMIGIASIGFSYLVGSFLNKFSKRIFSYRNIILVGIGIWLITGPLVDLGTAMVIVRSQRDDISRTELLWKTLEVYQDNQELQRYRQFSKKFINPSSLAWDENYLDNIFFARFSNLKFNDNSLELASEIRAEDNSIFDFTINRFLATLPRPVLSFLNIDFSKDRVNAMSFGDYLYYQGGGTKYALGGFRTGHFSGTGMAAFGWWYLLILGVGVIPLFFLIDSLVTTMNFMGKKQIVFSLASLISITSFFMFFPIESVSGIYAYVMRGWIQLVFLYWFIFNITRAISLIRL